MRVTTKAYTNNYLKNNTTLVNNLLKSENKILTQRKYNRASEDSVSAAKAAHVRKSLENLDIYDENCKSAKSVFYAAEDALYDVADNTYMNVKQKVVSIQDTFDQTELDIVATELKELADHMIQDMNTDFAERQLFGSMSDQKTPFTTHSMVKVYDSEGNELGVFGRSPDDEKKIPVGQILYSEPETDNRVLDKVVCYNDIPINMQGEDLLKAVQGGRIEYYDENGELTETKTVNAQLKSGATGGADSFPGVNPIYVDIGLGIKYDENGSVSPSTALDVCMNGAAMTGCGTDKDGDAKNIIQLVYDAAAAMRNGDRESVNRLIDKLDGAHTKVLNAITDLGVKQNNMDYYVERNSIYRLNLLEKQNDIEGCDLEEEITNWKTVEAAYNASLAMSSKVLPKSLFDFI